nr:competence type IV pilus minor pilin ComGD [Streptococcus oricebi]
MNIQRLPIKAFTLFESLLTLSLMTFVLLVLSGSVRASFDQVESQIFLLEFEHFYRESQKLSVTGQEGLTLRISQGEISNGYSRLSVPKSVKVLEDLDLHFDQAGGNSSLEKIRFQTQEGIVNYQLFIGNGKIKKTKD